MIRKLWLPFACFVLIAWSAVSVAWMGPIGVSGNYTAPTATPTPTPEYTCVGYANTACVPDSNPLTESAAAGDRTYTRRYTHSGADKTIVSVYIYMTAVASTNLYVRVYRQDEGSGNRVLIGHVNVASPVEDSWQEYSMVVYGAQSLVVDAADVIDYGISINDPTSCALGRNDAAGSLWTSSESVSATAPDPVTNTEVTNRDMALIMKLQ